MKSLIATSFLLVMVLAGCGEPRPTDLYVEKEAGSESEFGVPELVVEEGEEVSVPPFDLTVAVIDLDGNPVEGAGVVIRGFQCDWCDLPDQKIGLRSDATGKVSVAINGDWQLHAIAGGDNWTTEDAVRFRTTSGGSEEITIRLYPTTLQWSQADSYPLTLGEFGNHLYGEEQLSWTWELHSSRHQELLDRLTSVDFGLKWTNSHERQADLAAFAIAGNEQFVDDDSAAGEHEISSTVKATDDVAEVKLGVTYQSSTISLEGVAFSMDATAHFQGSEQFKIEII